MNLNPVSHYRNVFQTTPAMKEEFVKFLHTIFYQLDEKKVMTSMEEILSDPNKTDEQIYKELLSKMGELKKPFSTLWQIWALRVLKQGMGKQVAQHMKNFNPKAFEDYMEIYDRRYLDVIRKMAKLPLKGEAIAVCNGSQIAFTDKIQAGTIFSSFPYKTHHPLNDADCEDPLKQPEKTHKPIGDEISDNSVDMIACLGGVHHIPLERLEPFISSMQKKLKPGGVLLFRDHNVTNKNLESIAAVVHSFVNAGDSIPWEVENKEIRNFQSMDFWESLLKNYNFTPVSNDILVLKDDPTENGMMAFIKAPQNLSELRHSLAYHSDYARSKEAPRSTFIEWGNVRYSKDYAAYIQDHHAYAFDHIGHLRQHWQHFIHYIKDAYTHGVTVKEILLSDNFAMNLFILMTTTLQCLSRAVTSLPSALWARWQHGENWREVTNLTTLEKYQAKVEKEYSTFIDHTPFYMFDYIGKIKKVWGVIASSNDSWMTKGSSFVNATFWSLGLLANAAISAPIRMVYTSEDNQEPDIIKAIVKDPDNAIEKLQNDKIKVIEKTLDGHKLVSFPRYKPFTEICAQLVQEENVSFIEVAGHEELPIDVLLPKSEKAPQIEKGRIVYKMDKLQDPQNRRYTTYYMALSALKEFYNKVDPSNVVYIHE